MNTNISDSTDPRQFPQWGNFMQSIGWQVVTIDHIQIFIRHIPLPFFKHSLIKIEHPQGPIPFNKINQLAINNKALFVLIEPHLTNHNSEIYLENGYQISKTRFTHSATIKIDLKLEEQKLFKSFSENAQRNIKKAQQNKLKIKTVSMKDQTDNQAFDQFYSLLQNLGQMKKFYTASYQEQLKKMQAFKDTSYLFFAHQENSSEPIAAMWLAYNDNIAFYVQTGITQKGYDLLANYLLVWEGLKLCQELNLEVFDFESIYDPRHPLQNKRFKGYTQFKKRFHGQEVFYPESWIKFYNLPYKILYLCATIFSK